MDVVVDSGELSENRSAMAVTGFLQSLPNASLDTTAAYDDYPKYPLETLIDGGGDSEDASILAANLLDLMGYSTVLLGFPGHMAVGLLSNEDLPGRYYAVQRCPVLLPRIDVSSPGSWGYPRGSTATCQPRFSPCKERPGSS